MQPNPAFVGLTKEFWANVRTLSQELGYTHRGTRTQPGQLKVPNLRDCCDALQSLDLNPGHFAESSDTPTRLGRQVLDYFAYRAELLSLVVEPLLMDAAAARKLYHEVRRKHGRQAPAPMNKQTGSKKKPAYFTGIVNTLIQAHLAGLPCEYNPLELTTVTCGGAPFRTLARRIDGAFPGPVNPLAVWEIKEYYYTTTFGSRVADGVYETLLDGMELEELHAALRTEPEGNRSRIQHVLMVDAHFTWWVKGKSYLCRIIDMLHMGYVDEVLFGREVVQRLPQLVQGWVQAYRRLP